MLPSTFLYKESVKRMKYRILLYYKYVPIEDPVAFADEHRAFCQSLGVKGRILISHEGINGTLSGTVAQTNQYMKRMHQHPLFHDILFKIDEHENHAFKKLFVRPRKELVTWRLEEDVDPNALTGKHLSPKEFYEHLQREDVIVIDGRNDYEHDIGHFRGAIRPEIASSREFPAWIRKHLHPYKEQKIVTYCTGGIRCEKLTALLLKEGFQDVAQLEGGIITYGKDPDVKGALFDGKCYVFDERISVPINQIENVVVGRCYHCGKPEDRYLNCQYRFCNKQHVVCAACEEKYHHYCSPKCEEAEKDSPIS
jgi:UPF0176 protein